MSRVIDLTEQPEQQSIGPRSKPRWTTRDHATEVAKSRSPGGEFYDAYRFTGRTYRVRDVAGRPPADE